MSIIHYCMQQHELRPLTKSLSFAAANGGQKGEHTLCTLHTCKSSMRGAAAQQKACKGSVEQISDWTVYCAHHVTLVPLLGVLTCAP